MICDSIESFGVLYTFVYSILQRGAMGRRWNNDTIQVPFNRVITQAPFILTCPLESSS